MEAEKSQLHALQKELEEVRHQLYEARETIEAIRTGQVDALVVEGTDGHQLYTLKTADITYRVFIEKMTEGALTLNIHGDILYCNSKFASMVEQPLSSVIGASFINFVSQESRWYFTSMFQKAWIVDSKGEVNLWTNERKIPVQLSLAKLELEETDSISIIITDLTEQKKTQKQLELGNQQLGRMNRALELSNNDLQQFASVASHDLQEPLRKIQIFSKLLKDGKASNPEQSGKYLEKIIDSADRMKTLIIDVLNYSKLSATDNEYSLIDLNELLRELLEDFEMIIMEKKAVIDAGRLPVMAGNRGQIRQVFQNIISNALKFIKADRDPVITIRSKRLKNKAFDSEEEENGPYCLISIGDNGIGFDEKYVKNIFTLFERLHSKNTYEGTGIGLAITNRIIEKHHGLVTAKSAPGDGAEFLIVLPVSIS
ncbi:MAG TPA: ATP-binding protein [Flavitalea sp.]|nr:ATP-binding protein [Flavitalea sp.]